MSTDIASTPAASLSVEALAELFTRSFEGYFYPAQMGAEELARKARVEAIDLWRSVVLRVGGEPAGLALLGLRPGAAWCGGFGVAAAFRGRGLAHALTAAMVQSARDAGAPLLTLEVLTRNERAIRTYERGGLRVTRDLQILEWRRPEGAAPQPADAPAELDWRRALGRFAELHREPAAWQRDLPSLLERGAQRCLALGDPAAPEAYALLAAGGEGAARILDLGARDAAAAERMARALQAQYERVTSVNEPAGSPQAAGLLAAGFVEIDRQHEMELAL